MHLGKAQSALLQEQVARVLRIVQVVRIVDDTLDVAFIVAHFHAGFKNIFTHSYFVVSLFRFKYS